MSSCLRRLSAALVAAFLPLSVWSAEQPTLEQMWEIIQKQQREIEALKAKLQATEQRVETAEEKVVVTDQKVEATAQAVEQTQQAATRPSWVDRTTLGSYGEMHLNRLSDKKELDFTRFVLSLGYRFTDRLRALTEVELEHSVAGDDENGEIELEQAYIDYALTDTQFLKGGLFLLPVGILNETHEPTTFFGVERNPVETYVIPTSWWAGGAGARGLLGRGFSYNLDLTSGLDVPTSGSNAFLIRSGRQKVSEAKANDAAVMGRVKWTGMPGVELGVTGQYQRDVTQGELGVDATLFEAHADILKGPFGLRALYARWDLDGSEPKALGRDQQQGWYVEPSIRGSLLPVPGMLGLFARYNVWNNEAGSDGGGDSKQFNTGLNWWPHPGVVLKFDYQHQNSNARDVTGEGNGFNLGLGYAF